MGKGEDDVAQSPATSPETLDTLAKSRRVGVKMRVAANPNTRPDTLQYLAENNKAFDIIFKILENPKTPDTVFLYYVRAPKQAEYVRLLSLRKLSKEHLNTVIDNLRQKVAETKRSVVVWPPAPGAVNPVDDQNILTWMTNRFSILAWSLLAEALRLSGDWAGAMAASKHLSSSGFGMACYVMACLHVKNGRIESALQNLKYSFRDQMMYKAIALHDPAFDTIKQTPEFKKITKI